MKKSDIVKLVKSGIAIDITYSKDIYQLEKYLDIVEITFGTYGMNAGLFKHRETNQLYAITSRSTNLFILA